ncbi:MAG: hypothetical protein ACE5IW_10380 [bacterium]
MKNLSLIIFYFLIFNFSLTACGQETPAERVAEKFLYRYFIELNQQGALELSAGLAEEKLKKEIELLKSVRRDPDLDLSQHKPFIDYKLVNAQKRSDDSIAFFYDVSIKSKGGDGYKRQVVLTTVEIDGNWKVKNFDTFVTNEP